MKQNLLNFWSFVLKSFNHNREIVITQIKTARTHGKEHLHTALQRINEQHDPQAENHYFREGHCILDLKSKY